MHQNGNLVLSSPHWSKPRMSCHRSWPPSPRSFMAQLLFSSSSESVTPLSLVRQINFCFIYLIMSENCTAYSPILSLIMKSLACGMTQTCERLRPLPEVSNVVNPLSIPSLWAIDISWNISVSVVISLLLVLPENSINNGKLESLRPCGVRYWWLSGESHEMVQRREGEAQTRLCAESSWGQLLLPLSPNQE